MRRASLAGLETQGTRQYRQVPGGSFGRRLSLSTLGSGKYGRACDGYGDREAVIVRHVPIVIEGGEGENEEEKEVKVSSCVSQSSSFPLSNVVTDDLSSLSSMSSDNSVETSRRKEGGEMEGSGYQSLDDWRRKRGRKHGVVEMDSQLRTPFKDIKQHPSVNHETPVPRPDPRATPGPWYLLKTETVGVERCPVHGHGHGEVEGGKYRKDKKPGTMGNTFGQLRTPSLIRGRNEETGCKLSATRVLRPKHSVIPTQPGKAGAYTHMFERGAGQWSFRETSSKSPSDMQEKDIIQKPRKSDPTFQRWWSFRTPSVTPNKKSSDIPASIQAPTLASLSRSLSDPIPEYFRGTNKAFEEKQKSSLGKYPSQSQSHLNRSSLSSLTAYNSRSTHSSSSSSIPSKISQDPNQIKRENPPSSGILKTSGKRKVSLNNRVEFLNNVMEREIPSRQT